MNDSSNGSWRLVLLAMFIFLGSALAYGKIFETGEIIGLKQVLHRGYHVLALAVIGAQVFKGIAWLEKRTISSLKNDRSI